jgi:hypothetical protein
LKAIRVYRKTWIKDAKTGGWDRREELSWYITNDTARTAEFYAAAIRGHWGIENRDHRVRDHGDSVLELTHMTRREFDRLTRSSACTFVTDVR